MTHVSLEVMIYSVIASPVQFSIRQKMSALQSSLHGSLASPKILVRWAVYIPFLSSLHLSLEVSDEQIPGMQNNGI